MVKAGWREKDDRSIKEIKAYMEHERLDAFIPSKIPHIAYLTNYYDIIHMNITWEEMICILVIPSTSENGRCFYTKSIIKLEERMISK